MAAVLLCPTQGGFGSCSAVAGASVLVGLLHIVWSCGGEVESAVQLLAGVVGAEEGTEVRWSGAPSASDVSCWKCGLPPLQSSPWLYVPSIQYLGGGVENCGSGFWLCCGLLQQGRIWGWVVGVLPGTG